MKINNNKLFISSLFLSAIIFLIIATATNPNISSPSEGQSITCIVGNMCNITVIATTGIDNYSTNATRGTFNTSNGTLLYNPITDIRYHWSFNATNASGRTQVNITVTSVLGAPRNSQEGFILRGRYIDLYGNNSGAIRNGSVLLTNADICALGTFNSWNGSAFSCKTSSPIGWSHEASNKPVIISGNGITGSSNANWLLGKTITIDNGSVVGSYNISVKLSSETGDAYGKIIINNTVKVISFPITVRWTGYQFWQQNFTTQLGAEDKIEFWTRSSAAGQQARFSAFALSLNNITPEAQYVNYTMT